MARAGVYVLERGERFALISSEGEGSPPPPGWARVTLNLGQEASLHLERALCPPRHLSGAVRIGQQASAWYVERDALGRSPIVGARLGSGVVALSNDAPWLLSRLASPARVNAHRYLAHRAGWDALDQGVQDYFTTVFRVLPGHRCTIRGAQIAQSPWWDTSAEPVRRCTELNEELDAFWSHLDSALSHLSADDALAVSSGTDSTLLAARLTERSDHDARCWGSMSFPRDSSCDETASTRAWSARWHRQVEFVDMSELPAWGGTRDEKLEAWGPQTHPGERYERAFMRELSRRSGCSTVITGVGADQLFETSLEALIGELAGRGHWEAFLAQPWQRALGPWGVVHAVRALYGPRLSQRLSAPRRLERLLVQMKAEPEERHVALPIAEALLSRQEAPSRRQSSAAQKLLDTRSQSWAWEGFMRALWRLERQSGARIETPYLDEALWSWSAGLDARRKWRAHQSELRDKWLLRVAHERRYADRFPRGFAWRRKAAVFDAHIARGFAQEETAREVRDLIDGITPRSLQRRFEACYEEVRGGRLGRPLAKLGALYMSERWRQLYE